MKDYCKDPLCGWYLEVDKDGYCPRHSSAEMTREIQDAFGPALKDTTEEMRVLWNQIARKKAAEWKGKQSTRRRAYLKYWFIYPAMILLGGIYIFLWVRSLL